MPNRIAVNISRMECIEKDLDVLYKELKIFKSEGNEKKLKALKLKIEKLLDELDVN